MTAQPAVSLPVAVIMARKLVRGTGWSVPSWRAVGVVAGEHLAGGRSQGELIRTQGEEEHFLWGGFVLDFYRDAAQTYWENLTGENPALFVVCHERENGELRPVSVTLDQHLASATIEGSDRVFAAPIPAEIYCELERFVVEHYAPKRIFKRKRKNWSAESDS